MPKDEIIRLLKSIASVADTGIKFAGSDCFHDIQKCMEFIASDMDELGSLLAGETNDLMANNR